MPNTFGHLFQITTWGESHGGGVGVVIDGCPPRVPLTEADVQVDLDRRRPGQSKIVTPRKESDTCQILSGTFEGLTLGTPISIMVRNEDQRPEAYKEMETLYRPSTPTTPPRPSTASATGRVAVAPQPAKPSGGLRRARWQINFSSKSCPSWRSSRSSRRCMT
jgi:chorismate synthase